MLHADRTYATGGRRSTASVRAGAWSLIAVMLTQTLLPGVVYADGGPGQPEFSSFTPAGASDMVDPFSGDFHYAIPLLNIDGYPIELNYNSGVTMDQEASWVGLGWNVNVGSIQRTMRGMPDDFCGDQVKYENNVKEDVTVGLTAGTNVELFGNNIPRVSVGAGISYNNYHGFDLTKSFSAELQLNLTGGTSLTAGMNLQSGTKSGLSLYPKLSVQADFEKCSKTNSNHDANGAAGLTVGAGFSNRTGLTSLSIAPSYSLKRESQQKMGGIGFGSLAFDLSPRTYMPSASNDFTNLNLSGTFRLGGAFTGVHPAGYIGGNFSRQHLSQRVRSRPAFGYKYLERAAPSPDAVLDFNREKDGPYSSDIAAISLAGLTQDLFSVFGQGSGGSYRLYRSDIGNVFDAKSGSSGGSGDVSVEIGVGNAAHSGGNIVVNDVTQTNGAWRNGNPAANVYNFKMDRAGDLVEGAYFIEANEPTLDPHPERFASLGGNNAVAIGLNQASAFNVRTNGTMAGVSPKVKETARRPRSKLLSALTRAQARQLNPDAEDSLYHPGALDVGHHFSQLTATSDDGRRYVYGVPAYNLQEHDVTFALAADDSRQNDDPFIYDYADHDITVDNENGKDHYYQRTIIPPYAHSFLLTEVLSADYRDLDDVLGPSDNDLGDYVKFKYRRADDAFGWRTPSAPGHRRAARYNPGSLATQRDDKASYMYGQKELWYLDSIITRDHVAVFEKDARQDICSVDEDGDVVEPSGDDAPPQRLTRILYFTRAQFMVYKADPALAVPEQTVSFVYDYSLCPGSSVCSEGTGKLTLRSVYFTYGKSDASALAPYRFDYGSGDWDNPPYDPKSIDRWGGIKPAPDSHLKDLVEDMTLAGYPTPACLLDLPNSLYPYVDDIKPLADSCVQAWTLKAIDLPSGGHIQVEFESDEYGYVQDIPVMKMFPIAALGCTSTTVPGPGDCGPSWMDQRRVYFKLDPDQSDPKKYAATGDQIYFKSSLKVLGTIDPYEPHWDQIPGYAKVNDEDVIDHGVGISDDGTMGFVDFQPLDDDDFDDSNPMIVAGLNYARLNFSDQVFTQPDIADEGNMGIDLLNQLWGFFGSSEISALASGLNPNVELRDNGVCEAIDLGSSWIRLRDPDGRRMGGGSRVKEVRIYDRWDEMSGESGNFYGEHYSYDVDGQCSGVASYEPGVGGDENAMHTPVFSNQEKLLAPDERSYQETPFGEMFYPGPSVGYSRVTVTPVGGAEDPAIIKHGAGYKVHEFYTSRDFPVITSRTDRVKMPQQNPFNIGSLLKFDMKDFMTVSQGFSVELNSMHGKPKQVSEFASRKPNPEVVETPYKYTRYHYQCETLNEHSYRLTNKAVSLRADGTKLDTADLGVVYDVITDMRESVSKSRSVGALLNVDGFVIVVPLIVVPILPTYTKSETKFQSVGVNKVIQRFGLIDQVEQFENGSKVVTRNLAYDAETGQVLLTSVNDHFEQPVYSLRMPAYWGYDGMGPAYRNADLLTADIQPADPGVFTYANAPKYFSVGDELMVTDPNGTIFDPATAVAFVTDVQGDRVWFRHKDGSEVAPPGSFRLRVLSSGRRNMLGQDMATITTMKNPLDHWGSDQYSGVLQASAIEYDQFWRTNCDCIAPEVAQNSPFLAGIRGIWRPKRTWAYLTDRTWSREKGDVDIRNDGLFSEFRPFYDLDHGKWTKAPTGWTYVDELLDVDPLGQPIESSNAIGIHSANLYGYGGKKNTAVAMNAAYSDIGFVSFEDQAEPVNCLDRPFNLELGEAALVPVAHTGRNALLVPQGEQASIVVDNVNPCPPIACAIAFEVTHPKASEARATAANGVAPLNFSYEILAGTPSVDVLSNGFFASGSGAWKLALHVCDAMGCCTDVILEPQP